MSVQHPALTKGAAMWDVRMGELAAVRLREAYDTAQQAASAPTSRRPRGATRAAVGRLLVRWGTRLVAAGSPAPSAAPAAR